MALPTVLHGFYHRCQTLRWHTAAMALFLAVLATSAAARSEPELLEMQYSHRSGPSSRECKVDCSSARQRPYCGTDGQQYSSKCEIRRLRRCEGQNVDVMIRGKCPTTKEGSPRTKCQQERFQAEGHGRGADAYVPDCREDGSYEEVQCHNGTEYCWCVSPDGKPVAGSSVQGPGKKPKCEGSPGLDGDKGGRRSPNRHGRNHKPRRGKKSCPPVDRTEFNKNLIKHFEQGFARVPKPTKRPNFKEGLPIQESDAILDTKEKRVIEWKFAELDEDDDGFLTRKEIRDFKKLAKKAVRPRRCARQLDKYCDISRDRRIDRGEWSVCLGVDINKVAPERDSSRPQWRPQPGREEVPDVPTSSASILELFDRNPHIPESLLIPARDQPEDKSGEESSQNKDTAKNCEEAHRTATLADRHDPKGGIFIPECQLNSGGLYKEEQCHKSTEYCWCVDEQTGHPIPGTSTHKVKPNCDKISHRDLKGCPYNKKRKFLEGLMDTLTITMSEYAANNSNPILIEQDPKHSLEEQAVRWKFRYLDHNKNNILEKKEWKRFKEEIRLKKEMRKCGRNFLKYCDGNEDRNITMEEWIECLGLNEPNRNLPDNHKREGPNPFQSILQS